MNQIPSMTREEEAEFWKTQDATNYADATDPIEVTMGPRPENRCPVCEDVLLSRYVDIEIAGGQAVLRGLRELYCRAGHTHRLAPEAQRVVDAVEAVLRLVPEFPWSAQSQHVAI